MLIWHSVAEVPAEVTASVVTIGVFDGVHRGHRAVVGAAVQRAQERDLPAVVVTFDPHPVQVVRPQAAPPAVDSLEHRLALLATLGVHGVLVLRFDASRAAQPAQEFIDEVIVGALHARAVVVGEDFRFGHRAAGDVDLLVAAGQLAGFEVLAVGPVGQVERFSSTRVRQAVLDGDVETAAAVLGRMHRLEGVVVHGDHRGRQLGYPTANLDLADAALVPAEGIYAGWLVRADGTRLPAAISIGTNPTFAGTEPRVEGYALDRDDLELYGETVAFEFVTRLRATVRFDSVEALVEQMGNDVAAVRARLVG